MCIKIIYTTGRGTDFEVPDHIRTLILSEINVITLLKFLQAHYDKGLIEVKELVDFIREHP